MRFFSTLANHVLEKIAKLAKKMPENPYFYGFTITNGTTDYLTRVNFPRLFGWRVMLHHIHREDNDREMHNHPWKRAFSIILVGSYIEERLVQDLFPFVVERERKSVRWFNSLDKEDFHRIESIDGPLWTLFIAGERQLVDGVPWGFLDEKTRKLIPFNEYIANSGTIRKNERTADAT